MNQGAIAIIASTEMLIPASSIFDAAAIISEATHFQVLMAHFSVGSQLSIFFLKNIDADARRFRFIFLRWHLICFLTIIFSSKVMFF
jgi:hypothetical protein